MSDDLNLTSAPEDSAPAAPAKKSKAKKAAGYSKSATHPKYEEMVKAAILTLKDRKGSSRQAIKKYIAANFKNLGSNHDAQINNAIKRGVEKGIFAVPKGHSGSVKLIKPVKLAEKKPKSTKKKPEGEAGTPAKKAKTTEGKVTKAKSKASKASTAKKTTAKTAASAKKKATAKDKPKKSAGVRKKEAKSA